MAINKPTESEKHTSGSPSISYVYSRTDAELVDYGNSNVKTKLDSLETNKVDKVSGKGLSTNDFTTSLFNKLDAIEAGAEVNQDAYSKIKVNTTMLTADQEDDIIEFIGSNVTLTPDVEHSNITFGITKANVTNALGYTPPTTNTTYSDATQSAAGLMSATDKIKLDGMTAGAEPNQNAFSNIKVGSTTVAADGKTDTLELAGSNVTLTPDATNDKVTIGITKANVTSALGYTPPTAECVGTVTSVATGVGLTGGTISSSGTIKAKLKTETARTIDALTADTTTDKLYPVVADKSGYLAVGVPWTDNNTNDTVTSVDKHYAPTGTETKSASGGTNTNATGVGNAQQVITGVTMDAKGHVTAVTSKGIYSTDTTYESKAAADGGTAVSLVTTGEKYTWNSKTSNTGTVTSVATGAGLTGGTISTSGTIKANLVSETMLTNAAVAATEVAGFVYPVALDKNGKLAVNVPWEAGANTTYTLTQDATDGHIITLTPSSGSAMTITIPDNTVSLSDAVNSTSSTVAASSKAVKTAYDLAASKKTGTVTSVATGAGLTGGTISTSGTIKANLASETLLTNAAVTGTDSSNRLYPVALDKNGKLAVNVPWTAYSNATGSAAGLMSADHYNKLESINASAEPNQYAFSNIKVGSTTVAADSATDTLELAGSNVTLTPDATNDKVTIGITKTNVTTALGYTPPQAYPTLSQSDITTGTGTTASVVTASAINGAITSKGYVTSSGVTSVATGAGLTGGTITGTGTVKANLVSETALTNAAVTGTDSSNRLYPVAIDKNGKLAVNVPWTDTVHSNATTSAAGFMSAADKTKLDGIATGAQVNSITGVKGNAESSYRTGNVNITPANIGAIATSARGAANGVASLDSSGKVPSSQLPSYVDDVLEYDGTSNFPTTGESGKIYVDTATNKTYRWGGSAYAEISASLALGESADTAYRGDRGVVAYNHSQAAHARTDATLTASSSTNGYIKINGTDTKVYTHPAYTAQSTSSLYKITVDSTGHVNSATAVSYANINYTAANIVCNSASGTTKTTSALTNGNVYMNLVENSAVRSSTKISGSGATSVTTDASGNIVVSSTNTTYTGSSTNVGSASGWNAGSVTSASVSGSTLTITNGTKPSLTVTSTSVLKSISAA